MNLQLIGVLKELKWSEYETKVYATLVEKGAMRPQDLVNDIDIPSGRVYDVLTGLTKKGAVVQVDNKPAIYDAQNPRMVLRTLVSDLEKNIDEALKKVEPAWEKRVGALNNETVSSWAVRGRRGIETQIRSLINQTEQSLLFCDTDISWMGKKDLKQIKKLSDENKEIKIISTKYFREELENLSSLKINTLIGKDLSSYYIFDRKIALLKMSDNSSASIIKDEKFVTKMLKDFEKDNKSSKKVVVKEVVG